MSRGKKGFGSIKDGGGLHKNKGVKKSDNLGKLINKHRSIEEVLYTYTSNSDMVYDDMDFSIEEFSDMSGADLEELMRDINQAMKVR